jgi:hypothetical protein
VQEDAAEACSVAKRRGLRPRVEPCERVSPRGDVAEVIALAACVADALGRLTRQG